MIQRHTLCRTKSMELDTIILMQTFLRCISTKELSASLIKIWKSVSCFQLASLSTIVFADPLKIRTTCLHGLRGSHEYSWDTVQWTKQESRQSLLIFMNIPQSISNINQRLTLNERRI